MTQFIRKRYPVGLQTFSELREKNYLYIDKTAYVYEMAHALKYYICVLTTVLFLTPMVFAQQQDSIRILYIGNSYTYYHDLPQMVQSIVANIAQDFRMEISYKAYTPGGCTFKRHLQQPEEMAAIREGHWDYVVLQEQSSLPAMPTEVVQHETYPYARQLDSLVHVHNPQARVIFYMTWGHKDGCQETPDGYPLISTYQGMQTRLITSYLEMTYQNDAWCAPVGMVWQRVRKERPYQTLYWPDRSHPSVLGTYIAANTIFTTFFQKPYQTTFTAGLDTELAEYVQQTVQEIVLKNRNLLNLPSSTLNK